MGDPLRYLGVVSGLSGWTVILCSIWVNPWFIYSKHAFSDLGGDMAHAPWVFNNGMIVTGLLVLLYGGYLVLRSGNKVSTMGGVFTIVSGFFLFLIGVYPSGSYPHFFVSFYFFTQMDIAMGVCGIGLIKGNNNSLGKTLISLSIIGPIMALMVPWPSTALLESFGIIIMNIWTLLMLRVKH